MSQRHAFTQLSVLRNKYDTRTADVGIPEYWLADPLENDKWGALITIFELARSRSGASTYLETRKTTLTEPERSGTGRASALAPATSPPLTACPPR